MTPGGAGPLILSSGRDESHEEAHAEGQRRLVEVEPGGVVAAHEAAADEEIARFPPTLLDTIQEVRGVLGAAQGEGVLCPVPGGRGPLY